MNTVRDKNGDPTVSTNNLRRETFFSWILQIIKIKNNMRTVQIAHRIRSSTHILTKQTEQEVRRQ